MKTKKFNVGDPVLVDREGLCAEVIHVDKTTDLYCVVTREGKIFDVCEASLVEDETRVRRYITRVLFADRVKELYEQYMQENDWRKFGENIPTEFLDAYAKSMTSYATSGVYYEAKAAVIGVFHSLSKQHEHMKSPLFVKLKNKAKRLICVGV